MNHRVRFLRKTQQGATLIVALVILAIMTVIGIASMRGSNLEMKMIASARDKAIAFEAAESTLRFIESELKEQFAGNDLAVELLKFTGSDCSSATPAVSAQPAGGDLASLKGYCFNGSIDSNDVYQTCQLYPAGVPSPAINYWDTQARWEAPNTGSEELSVAKTTKKQNGQVLEFAGLAENPQFIVEFMCFGIKKRELLARVDDKSPGDEELKYTPLFRITALAEGPGGRARAMAQSMYRVSLSSSSSL